MSVTVYASGDPYSPGFSPQIFTALSTQVAQPNFSYTIVATDVLTSETQTFQLPPRPDDYCVFDARIFSEIRLTNYLPKNEYGWKQADGVRKIRVNIGETYGTNPAYASGMDLDYIVWNAILDWKEYPNYNRNDYVYNNLLPNIVYLNRSTEEDTYEDRSNYLYALTSQAGDIEYLLIQTYDAAGVQIGTSTIPNPYVALTDYEDKYLCIDIGHKGLTNITAGEVTGAYPILTDDIAYYKVYDVYDNGMVLFPTLLKTIYIKCEPRFDVYTLHYLDKGGNGQTLHFSKKSVSTLNKQQTTYSKLPFQMSGTDYAYSPSAKVKKVLSSDRTNQITLTTDWLTDDQVDYYQGILDSPEIYLDLGSATDYLQVLVVSNSYVLNKRYNERLYTLELQIEYAHSNTRQNG